MKIFEKYQEAFLKMEITQLNKMQEAVYESDSKQIVLHSPTGSGKTLAFLLSLLKRLEYQKKSLQCVILVPSRELCLQITEVLKKIDPEIHVVSLYGGHSIDTEKNRLEAHAQVVIGTPGRITDHLNRGSLVVSDCENIIIDEFDKLLQFGFDKEMKMILSHFHSIKFRFLSSATSENLIPDYMGFSTPETLDFRTDFAIPIYDFFSVPFDANSKLETILDLLCNLETRKTILFCNFRESVDTLTNYLFENGVKAVSYHGGMEQDERERSLIKFRIGASDYLVCTDLGARGMDIPEVAHVIHVEKAQSKEDFTHRNGRTSRNSKEGVVFFLQNEITIFDEDAKEFIPHLKEPLPEEPLWKCIFIGGGKKQKISKVDVVGFLCTIGKMKKSDIGMIQRTDRSTFVAISADVAEEVVPTIRDQKIKGQKLIIGFAR